MKVNKYLFRTAGAVGVMLATISVKADEASNATPAPAPLKAVEVPALPVAPKHKTARPQPTKADDGVIDIGKLEMVTERYPDGKVKIEREVGQNAAGNFINQGSFKQYSVTGEVVKSGDFLNGNQQGKWTLQLAKDGNHLFSSGQDTEWAAPFTSEATFQDGRLHGTWTIKDSHGQNIIQWSFENGTRNGTWTWWHPNGQKRLEATYVSGALSGEVQEWDRDGKVVNQNTYIDGKCVVKAVEWYTLGQKHFEGNYLHATGMPEATYDWWNTKIVTSARPAAVPDQQHGLWTEWYPGGNKKTEAQYDRGTPVGKITWWYENGQEQAEGEYEGGQKNGTWITWHPNGLKESLAEYKAGKLVSKEMKWTADGTLVESKDAQRSNANYNSNYNSNYNVYRGAQRGSTTR